METDPLADVAASRCPGLPVVGVEILVVRVILARRVRREVHDVPVRLALEVLGHHFPRVLRGVLDALPGVLHMLPGVLQVLVRVLRVLVLRMRRVLFVL